MTFAEFYADYPRKVGKKDAEKAWNGLKVTTIMAGHIRETLARRKRNDWKGRELKFIPYPAHFLRMEGFDEEVEAMEDDPLPQLATVSTVHVHHCTVCAIPHDWLHDDDMCWMTHEVICELELQRRKRVKQ